MQGLVLSQQFYEECALPLFTKELPDILDLAAFGLVGEGSECFGFDDSFSQDHDFGPAFCMWLPYAACQKWRDPIEHLLTMLPTSYAGFPSRMSPEKYMGRVGLLSIEEFYARFIGRTSPPETWKEWRTIPEHFLATATNGRVFSDISGSFTTFRQALLSYYPEDVRLKKMAARCAIMAQAGQYNVPRALQRQELGAALFATARFSEAAISLAFLLNKQYMPFYKWAHRNVLQLPILGQETFDCIQSISQSSIGGVSNFQENRQKLTDTIEKLCLAFTHALRSANLSDSDDAWMMTHASSIQSHINNADLRSMPEMLE